MSSAFAGILSCKQNINFVPIYVVLKLTMGTLGTPAKYTCGSVINQTSRKSIQNNHFNIRDQSVSIEWDNNDNNLSWVL